MLPPAVPPPLLSDTGLRSALLFALLAERLSAYYEHGQWITDAQASRLAADWLARSGRALPAGQRAELSAASDLLARQIQGSLSREAGLHTAHELMESLDCRYQSETGLAMMDECTRLVVAMETG